MKTKSKRFLNLATLCLALLGTTLLMEQPVKADGAGNSDKAEFHGTPYDLGVRDGYRKGLEDGKVAGKQTGTTSEPPKGSDSPKTSPYTEENQKARYTRAYQEWYLHGYRAGWHETHNQISERGEEENKTPEASHEKEGRQEENRTPEASHEKEGRQEESGSQEEDILSPIVETVETIIEAVLEAWTYVFNWFNS
ncbi:Uncharacterised protein [Streptococcus pyogenes]|uniref:hypothetical protein n=1 Tax=Streptococcus pyogenes TaxID=1314 RepID=UPI00109CA5ED|nr:hypothetical protein [Streptococcus pyogenes]NAZ56031.1 hypothetical protein [Streptococcus pyogenes]QCK46954.1 hypothetical protein ETT60_01955 [Streptococcus pyogenes]VGW08368.1 Uncharacterised protein [Streptococcus pyogenes]VGW22117.1 Uncharacterised protein [Streptococcus pyogenes]VHC14435.1 Uncharacterised protein [Streptococcus pyogenes]